MIFAVVLAAGKGSRMNHPILPKQYMDLCGKPVVVHTIRKMLLCDRFEKVYVAVHPLYFDYTRALVHQHFPQEERLCVILGADTREKTILTAVDRIQEAYGKREEDVIIAHDAVRPFVTKRIIEQNIDAVLKYDIATTAIQATDTIFHSDGSGFVTDALNRVNIYQGQTPDSFNMLLLQRICQDVEEASFTGFTELCQLCHRKNHRVYLVPGAPENIKLTTPGDYRMAKALARILTESE